MTGTRGPDFLGGEGLHVGRAAVPVVSADAFEVIPAAGSGTETPAVSFPPWECSVLRDACPCLCGGELWSAVVSCCGGAVVELCHWCCALLCHAHWPLRCEQAPGWTSLAAIALEEGWHHGPRG